MWCCNRLLVLTYEHSLDQTSREAALLVFESDVAKSSEQQLYNYILKRLR